MPSNAYFALHDVMLHASGGSTQIDHIIVSRYGIFVIETKNMKGWVFGGARSPEWKQVLYKKSYTFQNPLRQNYKHTKAVEEITGLPKSTIHSVVAFMGPCELKSKLPPNVRKGFGYISYIKSFKAALLTAEDVNGAIRAIHEGRRPATLRTRTEHVRNLKMRAGPQQKTGVVCPLCGNAMVRRVAKNGPRAGLSFWGCSRYPACRGITNID